MPSNDLGFMMTEARRILRNAARRIAYHWKRHIERNFATEGGEVGGWEPLKESTKRKRRRYGFPEGPILQMRGKLARGYKISVRWVGDTYIVMLLWDVPGMFGARNLAPIHHFGTGRIPQRKLYDEKKVEELFKKHMEKAVREIDRLGME